LFAFCDEDEANFSAIASSFDLPAEFDAEVAVFLVDDAGVEVSKLAELFTVGDAAHWVREFKLAPLVKALSCKAVLKSIPKGKEERLLLKDAALLLLVSALLFKSRAKDGFARSSAVSAASFIRDDEVLDERAEEAAFKALVLFNADVVELFVAWVLVLLKVDDGNCAPNKAKRAAEFASNPELLDEIDGVKLVLAVDPAAPSNALYGFW
jgi:hypothetical protein